MTKTAFAFLALATVASAAGPRDPGYIITKRGMYVPIATTSSGGQVLTDTEHSQMIFVQPPGVTGRSTYRAIPDRQGGFYLSNKHSKR